MTGEGVKLTKAQRKVLNKLLTGAVFIRDSDARELVENGLVQRGARRYAGSPGVWYDITPAGRAALAALAGEWGEGNGASVAESARTQAGRASDADGL
jgi:hypothetical protein